MSDIITGKGIKRGFAGLLNEEIIDMTPKSVSDTISRGGTTLQTARCMEFITAEGHKAKPAKGKVEYAQLQDRASIHRLAKR